MTVGFAAVLMSVAVTADQSRTIAEVVQQIDAVNPIDTGNTGKIESWNSWIQLPEVRKAHQAVKVRSDKLARQELSAVPTTNFPHREIMLAELMIRSGRVADAGKVLETLSLKSDATYELHIVFAELANRQNRFFDAHSHILAAESQSVPQSWSAEKADQYARRLVIAKGQTYEGRGDWQSAFNAYAGFQTDDKQSLAILAGLARTSFRLGRHRETLDHLKAIQTREPQTDLPEHQFARLALQQGLDQLAETSFKAALKSSTSPARDRALLAYADWLLTENRGVDVEKLLTSEKVADQMQPQSDYIRSLGLRLQGKNREAQTLLTELHRNAPGVFPFSNQLALVLIEGSDKSLHAKALQLAASNVQSFPKQAEALATLGWIQFRLGDLEAAKSNLERAMQAGAVSRDTLVYMARLQKELSDQLTNMAKKSKGLLLSNPGEISETDH